jgi:hypothetical protein
MSVSSLQKTSPYDLFEDDIKVITDNSDFCEVILVFGLPKVKWKVDEESGSMMPLNVTT